MKKFTKFSFTLLSLLVVIAMIGCAPKAVVTDEPAVTEEPVATEEPEVGVEGCRIPAPAEPTTVNIIGWSYPIIDFYFEEFEKCNGVENLTINTQLTDSGTAVDQIRLAAAAGGESTYDIILNGGGFAQELAEMNGILALDDLIAKYDAQYNLTEDIVGWADNMYEGKTYGVPVENNTELFFYRADLYEKYGLSAPDTWDDVIASCKVLQAEDSIDFPGTMTLYAGWAWASNFFYMLQAQGLNKVDENFMPTWTGPEGVAAVEKIVEMVDACMGDEGLTYSIDDSEISMETGGQAFAFTWASRGANMDNPEKSQFVGMINFSPAPRFAPGGVYAATGGGASLSIMSGSKVNPELLFQMIMEVTDYESQVQAATLGIASRVSVASVATARYYAASMETIAGGYTPQWNPANGLADTAMGNWLPLIMTGDYTVQEILDNAAAEYIEQATAAGFIK
jgi:ABC-type glycerol-3-phosphate transport system substrate-binding protein